jgi:hypothetical protein
MEYLIYMRDELIELGFELKTSGSDTIVNYYLSKKLKVILRCKFNHLINTLICSINRLPQIKK